MAPAEKVRKLRAAALKLAQGAAQHRRYYNKKQLASFVGMAIALSPAIPAARFKLLALYDSINSVSGWNKQVVVRLSNMGYRALKYFWSTLSVDYCVASWEPQTPTSLLLTDSRDFGFGVHLGKVHRDTVVSGLWPLETA